MFYHRTAIPIEPIGLRRKLLQSGACGHGGLVLLLYRTLQDETMYHPHMCLNCNVREVHGCFSDGNGEGFCSRFCRDEAHADEVFTDADEPEWEEGYDEPREDQFRNDVEADADTLASAGWGTDEDYGYYGDGEY